MHNLKYNGHPSTLMEIQRKLRQDLTSCDVLICSGDGIAMQAHRFILSSCSDFFREIFKTHTMTSDNEVTIVIPDIKSSILERVLTFIYSGEVCVKSPQLPDFIESINFLGIKSPISLESNKLKSKLKVETITSEHEKVSTSDIQQNTEEEIDVGEDCQEKEFEYYEIYNENGDERIIGHYSIEQIDNENDNEENNSDYILSDNTTEHQNTFTITTQSNKAQIIQASMENVGICEEDLDSKDEIIVSEDIVIEDEHHNMRSDTEDTEYLNDLSETKSADEASYEHKLLSKRNENLEKAVKSVIDEGLSLKKASELYSVSKTVLWRNLKNQPKYKMNRNPLVQCAIEKLARGETLKNVSKALSIPLSTLHRYKMKLYEQGNLPASIQVRKKDSREDLQLRKNQAVQACLEGMSQNHAATLYKIPKSTLWRYIKKISGLSKQNQLIKIKQEPSKIKQESLKQSSTTDDEQLETEIAMMSDE